MKTRSNTIYVYALLGLCLILQKVVAMHYDDKIIILPTRETNLEFEQVPTVEECLKEGMPKKDAIQYVISVEILNRQKKAFKNCEPFLLLQQLPAINGILSHVSIKIQFVGPTEDLDKVYTWARQEIDLWDEAVTNDEKSKSLNSLFED